MSDNEWIPLDDWRKLPVGTWLTACDSTRKEYNVANCFENNSGQRITIVGGAFSFDMPKLKAYCTFTPYTP